MTKKLLLTVVFSISCGCMPDPKQITAGKIGCLPTEMTISNETHGLTSHYWEAQCKGAHYICSGPFMDKMNCSPVKESKVKKTEQAEDPPKFKKAEQVEDPPKLVQAQTMIVVKNKAKLRKSPSDKSTVLKTMKKGEEVKIINQKNGWFLVELPGGETGWFPKGSLTQKD